LARPYKKEHANTEIGSEEIDIGLLDILFPFLLPIKGINFIAKKLHDTAEEELTDASKIQGELLELQMRYEMDEITEEEYDKKEKKLLERLEAIRKYKEKNKKN